MSKWLILFLFLITGNYLLFASPVDTTKNELYAWKLTNCFLAEPFEFDTTIYNFQIVNNVYKHSLSTSSKGIVGSPWKSNVYSSRIDVPITDFYFDQFYHYNLLTAENQLFYHSKKPYFDISWLTTTKKGRENQLNVLYTQNINKKWNIGVKYHLISSGIEYPRALNSQHSFNAFTSYTGEKYSMHTAFNRNKISSEENGGIVDSLNPDFTMALLPSASSVYYNRSFYISQQYKFGFTQKIVVDDSTTLSNFKEAGRLNYIILFDKNYKVYKDDDPQSGFYKDVFTDTISTDDSVYLSRFENTLYWSFKEIKRENFNGRLTVGSTFERLQWSMVDETDSIYRTNAYHTIKLYANLDARTKNFIFSLNGSYYLKGENGYKESDYEGNVFISKSIKIFKYRTNFYANLGYKLASPSLFEQNYRSNNFRWNNNFSDVLTSNLRFGIDIDKARLKSELLLSNIQNMIYFDSLAIPRQLDRMLNIFSISLNKDFNLGLFYMINKIVYQIPNQNDELRLPEWAIYHSFFLNKTFEKIDVQLQLGYDLNYDSKFRTFGYMPATGAFYLSNNRETGNYAYINIFVKFRIKSVLLFAKIEHFNNLLVYDKYYFLMDNYPAPGGVFKFGVSWRFKD